MFTLFLNENNWGVTSVIDVDMPFFAVDSVVVFDLFTDERELLFVLTSFIVDCDC